LKPCLPRAAYAAGNFCCLYEAEDSSLLGSSIIAMGGILFPMILPCSSVSGPGVSKRLAFFTGVRLGQYSIVRLVQRYPPALSSWVNGTNLVLQYEQKYLVDPGPNVDF
jgi:hypothetical protein